MAISRGTTGFDKKAPSSRLYLLEGALGVYNLLECVWPKSSSINWNPT